MSARDWEDEKGAIVRMNDALAVVEHCARHLALAREDVRWVRVATNVNEMKQRLHALAVAPLAGLRVNGR